MILMIETLVSWYIKKQNCVSLSTAKFEYKVASSCVTQLVWLNHMLHDYGLQSDTLLMFCDNLSVINISKNLVKHSRTKHIDIRHHFLHDLVDPKLIDIQYIETTNQLVDIFTKPLDNERFFSLRKSLGICVV